MAPCHFCYRQLGAGPRLVRSKEHIFAQWPLEDLEIADSEIQATHFSSAGDVKSTRHHTMRNLVAGGVCADCNNGWMSQLETRVRRILLALMTNDRTVVDLAPDERELLARWTLKTCYALNLGSNFEKTIPEAHRRALLAGVPNDVCVCAQQHHETAKFNWIQSSTWMIVGRNAGDRARLTEISKTSYKIALQLGKLLVVVAYWAGSGDRLLVQRGIHVPLWPASGPISFHKDALP